LLANVLDGGTLPAATVPRSELYILPGNNAPDQASNGVQVMVLDGDFAKMGRAYGALLWPQVGQFMVDLNSTVPPVAIGSPVARLPEDGLQPKYMPNSLTLLQNFQNGVPAADQGQFTLDKMIGVDQSVSLSYFAANLGCSYFVVTGPYTTDGQTVVGRHFDWAQPFAPAFTPNTTLTILKPTGYNPVALMNYSGQASGVSAAGWIDGNRVSIALLNGMLSTGEEPDNLDHLPGVSEEFSTITNVLLRAQSINDVYEGMANLSALNGSKWQVAIEGMPGLSFEMSPFGGNKVYAGQVPGQELVVTNTFQNPDWTSEVLLGSPQYTGYGPGQLDSPSHTFLRLADLTDQVQSDKGQIDLASGMGIIQTPMLTDAQGQWLLPPDRGGALLVPPYTTPNNNIDYTYYSFVRDLSQPTLAYQVNGLQSGPWNLVDLDALADPQGPVLRPTQFATVSGPFVWNTSTANWGSTPDGGGAVYAPQNPAIFSGSGAIITQGQIGFTDLIFDNDVVVQPSDGASN
jgi:hypothetical protein